MVLRRAAAWCGVAVLIAFTVALIGFRMQGGRWVRVETASMGTEAPVGTLLWIRPTDFDSLRPGDLITFHPPGRHDLTYSHLVHTVNADGTLSTQGRITAPDPWKIAPEDLIGKVVMRWPGAGWVLLAAPVLVPGALLVLLLVRRIRDRDLRLPVAVVGGALVVVVALVAYRPLTQAEQLSFVPVDQGARATYVSTGLLPLRLTARGADPVILRDGQVGSVVARKQPHAEGHSRFAVTLHPHIPFGWWVALVGLCFAPALTRPLSQLVRQPRPRH
jgi:hypothetical protein